MTLIALLLMASTYAHPDMLVETAWLEAHLADADVRVVDMRMRGYEDGRVPGAVLLRNDEIRDALNPPTFLPSPARFEALMGRLGISNTTHVVAYDDRGGIYAARLWWILNYYGHTRVSLLNGGWTKWTLETRAVSADAPGVRAAAFVSNPDPRWLATASDVQAAINRADTRIVDARTQAEIEGRDLRGIRRGGFVPSAVPVYWEDALDPVTKAFRPADELILLFRGKGVLPEHHVIAYCQVGMRASHDLFAMRLVGYERLRNYYGSWEEWGNRDDLPIATAEPR